MNKGRTIHPRSPDEITLLINKTQTPCENNVVEFMRARALLYLSLLVTFVLIAASGAASAASDTCALYGYVPHTRDYAVCSANLRYY